MFVVLWEFEVKPGCEERFQTVYGPEGDWARFFQGDPAFRETRLARDTSRPRTYLTLDFWNSRSAYESFRDSHKETYREIDERCEAMMEKETHLGSAELTTENPSH